MISAAVRTVSRSSALRTFAKSSAQTSLLQGTTRNAGSQVPKFAAVFARGLVTKRFTSDHEWVSYDSETGIGTVSITNYAQSSLGDVVFVELPQVSTEVAQGDQIGAVESVKAASDIYAPVSGVVEEVNEQLGDQPGLLNKSPEADGWLCKVKMSDPSEMDTLLSAEAYKAHCES